MKQENVDYFIQPDGMSWQIIKTYTINEGPNAGNKLRRIVGHFKSRGHAANRLIDILFKEGLQDEEITTQQISLINKLASEVEEKVIKVVNKTQ